MGESTVVPPLHTTGCPNIDAVETLTVPDINQEPQTYPTDSLDPQTPKDSSAHSPKLAGANHNTVSTTSHGSKATVTTTATINSHIEHHGAEMWRRGDNGAWDQPGAFDAAGRLEEGPRDDPSDPRTDDPDLRPMVAAAPTHQLQTDGASVQTNGAPGELEPFVTGAKLEERPVDARETGTGSNRPGECRTQ